MQVELFVALLIGLAALVVGAAASGFKIGQRAVEYLVCGIEKVNIADAGEIAA